MKNNVVDVFISGAMGSGKTMLSERLSSVAMREGFGVAVISEDEKTPTVTGAAIKRLLDECGRVLVIHETSFPVGIIKTEDTK